jgi:hypothetical protein
MQECVICKCTVCLNAHVRVLHRLLALCAHARNLNLGEMRWPAAHRYLLYSRPTGWNINEGMQQEEIKRRSPTEMSSFNILKRNRREVGYNAKRMDRIEGT